MSEPPCDYYDHPVFHPSRLRLHTPAMATLSDDLHRWLWTGCTGGYITGEARIGKTTAILALRSTLRTRGALPIPTEYVSIPMRDQKTVVSVFRNLCWSAKLPVKTNDRADHLSDRYVHYLIDRSVESKCPYVVLIVDEMQHLVASQFNAFAEIYDTLRLIDINLMVIFVGNDQESNSLLEQVETSHYAHVRGRFFTQSLKYRGLASKEQVKDCLRQYDALRYPDDGHTYTAFFLPQAAENGWQLASLSADLWRIFHEYQSAYHIESWGMQYFTAAINTLLTDFLAHHGIEAFDDDMVHECIRMSGLVPALVTAST